MSDRYEIQGKIAQGGAGVVYKAWDKRLQRKVAIKRVLTTEDNLDTTAEQLLQEATTLSALQHPNIVTIFDVGNDEKGVFVIMELLDGETLENQAHNTKEPTQTANDGPQTNSNAEFSSLQRQNGR